MCRAPKAGGQRARFRGARMMSSVHHEEPTLKGALLVKPRFNLVEWTVWFRAMWALRRFAP